MDDFAAGDRRRLFRMAEGHAELLGAAGDGRRASAGPIARTGSPSPSCRPSSRRSTAATSAPPKTWTELKQIAEFFQGREIDGKKVYGACDLHRARLRRHHHGRDQRRSIRCGFKYEDPKKPYDMEGFVNSPDAVKGLEFYKALYKCCTPPG